MFKSLKRGSEQILIAEGNPINLKVIQAILNRAGITYKVASTGEEVVKMFQKNKFQLVLMDCQMPGMGGIEATQAIRDFEKKESQNERCPIIALTANAMIGDREKCLEAGMDDFLSKPFKNNDLLNMIGKWSQLLQTTEKVMAS